MFKQHRLFYPLFISHDYSTTMYPVDDEGFLDDPALWDKDFPSWLAQRDKLALSPAHRELIEQTRLFYNTYGFSPSMRPLVKFIGGNLGINKGKSIYLMTLFPPSPAKALSKFAGLHKPKNCL